MHIQTKLVKMTHNFKALSKKVPFWQRQMSSAWYNESNPS